VTYDRAIVRWIHLQALRGSNVLFGRIRRALDQHRGRTSVTDVAAYTRVCDQAARDPAVFSSFKRHSNYTPVLEHVTREEGGEYLRIALEQTPSLRSLLDRFRDNDRLGSPQVWDYGEQGAFSATTLRYVKVVSDLITLFGSLDGFQVAEIGCGYGGQCFTIHVASQPRSYTLIDLEPCLRLQSVYLNALGLDHLEFIPAEQPPEQGAFDLVLSNYAFSECTREVQENYLAHILCHARRGYLTCNWISPQHFRSLTQDELLAAIPGSKFLPEAPRTAPDNRIWVWGTRYGSVAS
jgi:putative sugar O-methyltransferase